MEAPSLETRSRYAQQGLLERAREPLRFWHHSSEATRKATAHVGKAEVYLRSGSKGGKTNWGAHVGTAIAQRWPSLDGIPLPHVRARRIVGVVLALDHPQQRWSVQPAYEQALGDWPHHVTMRDGIWERVLVQPLGGTDDKSTWSEITFVSQKNLQSGTGARGVHWVHADEPPQQRIWNEFKKAAHAGQKIYRWITATPLVRQQFQWLREEYKPEHLGEVHHGRVEFRLRSLYFGPDDQLLSDNSALTPEDLQNLYWFYENDELREAYWAGEYVDAFSDNPYDRATLLRMKAEWATEPEAWEVVVRREAEREAGLKLVKTKAQVDVWLPPRHGLRADITVDPSRGFKSRHHDPGAIIATDEATGELLAMYEGYLGSYGLGRLAAIMARQYGEGWVDFENNGGYGEGVARGLAAAGYSKIRRQRVELEKGKWEVRLGWTTTERSRGSGISGIQDWISAYHDGVPYAKCRSAKLYDCLLDVLIDKNGKAVAAPGLHDELQTVWGQRLRNRAQAPVSAEDQRARQAGVLAKAEERRRPREPGMLEGEITIARLAQLGQRGPRSRVPRGTSRLLERPGG